MEKWTVMKADDYELSIVEDEYQAPTDRRMLKNIIIDNTDETDGPNEYELGLGSAGNILQIKKKADAPQMFDDGLLFQF